MFNSNDEPWTMADGEEEEEDKTHKQAVEKGKGIRKMKRGSYALPCVTVCVM